MPISIPYYNGGGGAPLIWYIGGALNANGSFGFYSGSLAEVFFYAGAQVNINDPNIVVGFLDASTGLPMRNSSDGRSAIQGLAPQIYLSGGEVIFPLNLPPYCFTWVSASDTNPPSSFYTATSALHTALLDPRGNVGV